MNKQRIYYYFLYLLPIAGILGKVIGWATFSNHFLTQWFSEGLILLFFILEAKTLYTRFNPGIKMLALADGEEVLLDLEVQKGWLFIGIGLRLFYVAIFIMIGLIFLQSYTPEYVFSTIFFLLAGILMAGIFQYLKENPYRILVTKTGIRSYIFRYFAHNWDEIKEVAEKDNWVVLRPDKKSFKDIEYEDLIQSPEKLLGELRKRASKNGFQYKNERMKPEFR